MLDFDIIVSEFELQSYYVHFWTYTLERGMKPSYPPRDRLNSTTTILLQRLICH